MKKEHISRYNDAQPFLFYSSKGDNAMLKRHMASKRHTLFKRDVDKKHRNSKYSDYR